MNTSAKILVVSAIIALLGVGVWFGVRYQRSPNQNAVPQVAIASLGTPTENWLVAYPGAVRADGWMLLEFSKIVAVVYTANGRTPEELASDMKKRPNSPVDFEIVSRVKVAKRPAIQFTDGVDFKTVYTMFSYGNYIISVELSNAEPKVTYEDGTDNQEEMRRAKETNRSTYDSALRSLTVR